MLQSLCFSNRHHTRSNISALAMDTTCCTVGYFSGPWAGPALCEVWQQWTMDRPGPVRGMAVHLFRDHVGVVRCASFLFERQTRKRVRCKPYVSTFTSMGVYIYSLSSLPARSHLKNGSLHCPPEVGSMKKSTRGTARATVAHVFGCHCPKRWQQPCRQ